MKIKFLKISILAVSIIAVAAFYSCSRDSAQDMNDIYNDFGEITHVGNNGYFEITRDDKSLLRVLEYAGAKTVKLSERVYFKYYILSQDEYSHQTADSYNVKVLLFNNITAHQIVQESFLADNAPYRSDSIGNDPIRICEVANSGNYINIKFEYFRRAGSNRAHMINLVWDDTRNPTDSVYLQMRHNAMGEVEGVGTPIVIDTGLASFKLSDLVPEGRSGIDIKLRFSLDRKDGVGEYIKVDKSYNGTFISETKTYIVGDELMPPADNTDFVSE